MNQNLGFLKIVAIFPNEDHTGFDWLRPPWESGTQGEDEPAFSAPMSTSQAR